MTDQNGKVISEDEIEAKFMSDIEKQMEPEIKEFIENNDTIIPGCKV